MFEFRPELVDDDDEEADDTRYTQGTGSDEVRRSFGTSSPHVDEEKQWSITIE